MNLTWCDDRLAIGASQIHGRGCVTTQNLPAGTCIGVFGGQWMVCNMGDTEPVYPPGIDPHYCIDVAQPTPHQAIVMRLRVHEKTTPLDVINHEDRANCAVRGLSVWTMWPISAGTELTIDYRDLDCTPLQFEPADDEG